MKTNCHDCCYPAPFDQDACGCCEGIKIVTPVSVYNRPGLSQIRYRIGTHSAFLETMINRLTGFYLEIQDHQGNIRKVFPLKGLTTRDGSDSALALLDAWATVADVLTFYQERIANEGYLRTATERRSIVELAGLVGYQPRPGVAAGVFLAYGIDTNTKEEVLIPAGSRVQSIPGPNELPQSFETGEDLKAKAQWNNLRPRMTQGQTRNTIESGSRIYLKGINTGLKSNDLLLLYYGTGEQGFIKFVYEIFPENEFDRTLVTFSEKTIPISASFPVVKMIQELVLPVSVQPANQFQLQQSLAGQFALKTQITQKKTGLPSSASGLRIDAENISRSVPQAGYAVLGAFSPALKRHLGMATASAKMTEKKLYVHVFRAMASLFGHNAPREPRYEPSTIFVDGRPVSNPNAGNLRPQPWPEWQVNEDEAGDVLYLDRIYKEILPGHYIAVQRQDDDIPQLYHAKTVKNISRNAYGISGETTRIQLDQSWWIPESERGIQTIRTTRVYVHPEMLEPAQEPITMPVCGGSDDPIELDGFYEGLEAGRWVIVSGERTIEGTEGIRFSEPALLASVSHNIQKDLPDEKLHTFVRFAENLAYCFKRDTVTIYGNVVKATHGESRTEILGSGDGTKSLQTFSLNQFPLTYVSAANPSGITSTLRLFINNIEWHETDSLAGLEADDRRFITRTDNEGKTSVIFGNGIKGARLPTGVENILAQYRNGIGKTGNVKEEQISLLISKLLGIKEVINPLPSSGGTDKETLQQARQHAPLAVKALDRLVSVRDYEDFCRIYGGIGKAHAIELSNGRERLIHVTIAGVEDVPIDPGSDLFRNLRQTLHDFGDPFRKIQLAVRELLMIVIEAGVAIMPDYQWESVVTEVRGALLGHFSFENRELGQDVILSQVISVIQSVPGVLYVDVNAFGGIPEKKPVDSGGMETFGNIRRFLTPGEISDEVSKIIQTSTGVPSRLVVNHAAFENNIVRPSQLAFLSPDVPSTLILNRIE
jgi:hypothetical protein